MMSYLAFLPFPLYLFGIGYRPVLYAGFIAQAAYILLRGVELGRIPLVGVHDTLGFFSASMAAFSIPLYKTMKDKKGFYISLAIMLSALTAFAAMSKPHAMPLPPVLKTYWFELHVALSFFSYALFGIAAIVGGMALKEGEGDHGLERLEYKYILIGYSFFSLSMIFGGIWAYLAWGTYWLWTPKELWTTILWIFYSLYLHARLRPGWAGRPSIILGMAGFALVLFTYLGVGLLMKSSHAF